MRSAGFPNAAPASSGRAGFTLIEVVVALAVLALALGAVFPQFGTALRLGGAAADERMAVLVAESALAELAAEPGLAPGTYDGRSANGMRWTGQVASLPVAAEPPRTPLPAFLVTVEAQAADGRGLVRLSTVALGGVQ